MDRLDFAAAIRQAVRDSGMKRQSIAEAAGMAESHVRAIENGVRPNMQIADRLLRALGARVILGDPTAPDLQVPAARVPDHQ